MIDLMRAPDWRIALMQYLADAARAPLRFGTHDCAIFAAGAVKAMTGHDFAAAYRGRYDSLAKGLRLLARDGFADHVALARASLPSVPVATALPGDLAVVPSDPVAALGVVQGASIYVLAPTGGLGLVALTEAGEVFRV